MQLRETHIISSPIIDAVLVLRSLINVTVGFGNTYSPCEETRHSPKADEGKLEDRRRSLR